MQRNPALGITTIASFAIAFCAVAAAAAADNARSQAQWPAEAEIAGQIGGNRGESREDFIFTYYTLSKRGTSYGHSAYNEATRRTQAYNLNANLLDSDRDPADVALRRTRALLDDLKSAVDLSAQEKELAQIEVSNAATPVSNLKGRFELFEKTGAVRRQIAFKNPLLRGIDRILFIKREAFPAVENLGNHMCDQYFGFHATQGGKTRGDGLFILEQPFSAEPRVTNVLEKSIVENGRFQGRKLDFGGFLSPALSYDGKRILFSWTEGDGTKRYVWNEHTTFHIFKVNVDGTHLVQITDGPYNDIDPCWLPNGRVVFISERRGGFGRCHGRPVPSFTLHTMFDDGSDIVCISPHETNEWQPSVDNNGMIVYTRWDYVDRGFNQAHQAWLTYPDGRDARAINSNTRRSSNNAPQMEMDVHAIPGSPCYVATAAPHHGEAHGSFVLLDPRIPDDDAMSQIKRITPDQLFPEAEFGHSRQSGAYAFASPLSEKYFLCVYERWANAQYAEIDMARRRFGVTLLDAFGNKELLYRDPQISCLNPIVLSARPLPPVIPHQTLVGRPSLPDGTKPQPLAKTDLPKTAVVGVMNVYNSRYPLPTGAKIKYLRIWQLFPKVANPGADHPKIGYGSQKGPKADLGIVPVEEDGSACWEQPVGVPVLFHALDENGVAIQGMRSASYVHPGETLMCNGCHEPQPQSPRKDQRPLALQRAPSRIQREYDGTAPFSYPRLVQPVLDHNCISCHDGKNKKPDLRAGDYLKNPNYHYTSFTNLRPFVWFYNDAAFTDASTIPGQFGARMSKLYQMLQKGHQGVKLSGDDMRRLTIWLDSNGLFFGHDNDIKAQAAGQVVPPSLE